MTATCSTDPNVGCAYNFGDGVCHHPRKKEGRALPHYEAGRIDCLWGLSRRHNDPADTIRAQLAGGCADCDKEGTTK